MKVFSLISMKPTVNLKMTLPVLVLTRFVSDFLENLLTFSSFENPVRTTDSDAIMFIFTHNAFFLFSNVTECDSTKYS